jgi:septum formation protein
MDKEREPQAGSAERERDETMLETLVLASSSPRRAEILRAVGWPFETCPADVDETREVDEEPVAYVERLAREKALAIASRRLFGLVLGADTVVVIDGLVLGKPRHEREARDMLRLLSGREHEVLTGVALVRAESKLAVVGHERTLVRFGKMDGEEIDWHIRVGEPLDKAGAYAVQGHAALFIEAIRGDYWNVVGLPIRLVYKLSKEMMNAATTNAE